MDGAAGVGEAISTFAIAIMYDEFNDGSDDGKRGVKAMFLTAGISTLVVFAYLPLAKLVPKKTAIAALEKKFRTVEDYEALNDAEFRQVTLEELEFQENRRMYFSHETLLIPVFLSTKKSFFGHLYQKKWLSCTGKLGKCQDLSDGVFIRKIFLTLVKLDKEVRLILHIVEKQLLISYLVLNS